MEDETTQDSFRLRKLPGTPEQKKAVEFELQDYSYGWNKTEQKKSDERSPLGKLATTIFEGQMEEARNTPPSKEDRIIKLLEEILERMPPKPTSGEPPGHGFCRKPVWSEKNMRTMYCIKTPNHSGKCEIFE